MRQRLGRRLTQLHLVLRVARTAYGTYARGIWQRQNAAFIREDAAKSESKPNKLTHCDGAGRDLSCDRPRESVSHLSTTSVEGADGAEAQAAGARAAAARAGARATRPRPRARPEVHGRGLQGPGERSPSSTGLLVENLVHLRGGGGGMA